MTADVISSLHTSSCFAIIKDGDDDTKSSFHPFYHFNDAIKYSVNFKGFKLTFIHSCCHLPMNVLLFHISVLQQKFNILVPSDESYIIFMKPGLAGHLPAVYHQEYGKSHAYLLP